MPARDAVARAKSFCESFNLRAPIVMAPMAGACPASLAIADEIVRSLAVQLGPPARIDSSLSHSLNVQ